VILAVTFGLTTHTPATTARQVSNTTALIANATIAATRWPTLGARARWFLAASCILWLPSAQPLPEELVSRFIRHLRDLREGYAASIVAALTAADKDAGHFCPRKRKGGASAPIGGSSSVRSRLPGLRDFDLLQHCMDEAQLAADAEYVGQV